MWCSLCTEKGEDVVFLKDEKSTESRDSLCTVTIL